MPNPDGPIAVADYVRGDHSPVSHLAHGWELCAAIPLGPAVERSIVREPAQAVPDTIAGRLGPIRVLLVPYIGCTEQGDFVEFSKPGGEAHTSVWLEVEGRTHMLLACRELDAHDTGFELLACVAELLRPRLTADEVAEFERLLEGELRQGVTGEIDEEAVRAKQAYLSRGGRRRQGEEFEKYRDVALIETVAEYMHGLWHDVQIRVGPEHLPVPQLRHRMELLARQFPPNIGYRVFDEALESSQAEAGSSD